MTRLEWVHEEQLAGTRLEHVVHRHLPEWSRSAIRQLFTEQRVRVDGRVAVKGLLLPAGARVVVELPEAGVSPAARPDPAGGLRLRVILERLELVVVDKPAGQPSAPLRPGEQGCLASALLARYPEMAGCGCSPQEPGLVHRLDTDTSGLLLAARTASAFAILRDALTSGAIHKTYLLICRAAGLPTAGQIDVPLAPHPRDHRRVRPCPRSRDRDRYGARPALTRYQVLQEQEGWALVLAEASPALRHQLRVHFAWLSHPLAGDQLYGGPTVPGLPRHALHAHSLSWRGTAVLPGFEVVSDWPADLAQLVSARGAPIR